ncbi:hypothetical protein [Shinella sp.]|uniref:hypothetical protein n=1 Tax=Shinella sp. TaxID=1870904 RepID=UPI0025839328|nr:hypothetical protein [Shinella sp.]MCW5710631.1 hypothetical protein [Shinella sp.]
MRSKHLIPISKNNTKIKGTNMSNSSIYARHALQSFISFITPDDPETRKPLLDDIATGLEADVATWYLAYERTDDDDLWAGLTDEAFAAALKDWAGGRDLKGLEHLISIGGYDETLGMEIVATSLETIADKIEAFYLQAREVFESLCSLTTGEARQAFEDHVPRGIVTEETMREINASLSQVFIVKDDVTRHAACLLSAVCAFVEPQKAA